jgi:hypothetical protein
MAANWTDFVSGNVLTAAQLNGVVDNFADVAIFNETQASGTDAGGFTSGSYVKRVLNTTVVNNITGCSIASSVITLPAGSYRVLATAPAFFVDRHKTRLQNTTATTTIAIGTSELCASGDNVTNCSTITTYFTLSVSSTIELQHRCASTKTVNGLGISTSFGDSEVYATIQIEKVA